MKLLIVEDDAALAGSMQSFLEAQHYRCAWAPDYATALRKTEDFDYDCIVLDLTLPGGDGLRLLEAIKAAGKADGVIIISARAQLSDKIEGLKGGADDYLTKPFHLSELSVRIAAIIRRRNLQGHNKIVFEEIEIDVDNAAVWVYGKPTVLTRKEYELLLYLVINKGRVLSKAAIAAHLWGDTMDSASNFDFLYTHIKNLRRKIEGAGGGNYLQSIYGMGYKFCGS